MSTITAGLIAVVALALCCVAVGAFAAWLFSNRRDAAFRSYLERRSSHSDDTPRPPHRPTW